VEHATGRQPASGAAVSGILRVPRSAALAAIAVLVAGASLVSFAESYRGACTSGRTGTGWAGSGRSRGRFRSIPSSRLASWRCSSRRPTAGRLRSPSAYTIREMTTGGVDRQPRSTCQHSPP